jgi:hypothetical protein
MNTVKPPVDSHNGSRGDDVDGLLRDFFRAEMPHPWPEMKLPSAARNGFHARRAMGEGGPAILPLTPKKRPWAVVGPRLALAASVGLLLVSSLFLSGQFKGNTAGNGPKMQDGGADHRIPRMDIKKERIEIPIEEQMGPDGKPIRKAGPASFIQDFYDQGF